MRKGVIRCFSTLSFALSIFFFLDSQVSFTGAFLGLGLAASSSFGFSVLFFIAGMMTMQIKEPEEESGLERRIVLTSALKHRGNENLRRLAEISARNQDAQRDLNHLVYELSKGNIHAGLPPKRVPGTRVFYLRAKRGGRLYYHQIHDDRRDIIHYEIVGKSDKDTQDRVIGIIMQQYGR